MAAHSQDAVEFSQYVPLPRSGLGLQFRDGGRSLIENVPPDSDEF
ncbi:MAG TPA: hypothetical protein VGL63_14765 [Streptosporangiaceae bacterium]